MGKYKWLCFVLSATVHKEMLWFWLQCDYWEVYSFMMQSSPSSCSNSNVTALIYAAACVALCATIPLSWCVTQLTAMRADPAWWCQHAPSNPWQCECPLLCIKQRNESCRTGKLGKKKNTSSSKWTEVRANIPWKTERQESLRECNVYRENSWYGKFVGFNEGR